jgi:hypothetical protein
MFVPLASAPLADDGLAAVSAFAAGALPLLGIASGTAPGPQGAASGAFGLAGAAAAQVPVLAVAAGGIGLIGAAAAQGGASGAAARAAFPEESRNSAKLLTGALRQGRFFSNQTTGDPE